MSVNVVPNFLRVGHKFRPGTPIIVTSITMHNTGNPTSTAKNERAWLDNPSNINSNNFASWHYVIDQHEIIQAIPDNEMAYHAKSGNSSSIGIEVCESGNQKIVWDNTVKFVATLLSQYRFGVDRITTHQRWTGKRCPRLLLPRWQEFIAAVQVELNKLNVKVDDDPVTKITIELNRTAREFNGVMHEGRAHVPVRQLLESLGYQVGWDAARNIITISKNTVAVATVAESWTREVR